MLYMQPLSSRAIIYRSMSFAVAYQSKHLHEAGEGGWEEGDVVLTNHPVAGGRFVC